MKLNPVAIFRNHPSRLPLNLYKIRVSGGSHFGRVGRVMVLRKWTNWILGHIQEPSFSPTPTPSAQGVETFCGNVFVSSILKFVVLTYMSFVMILGAKLFWHLTPAPNSFGSQAILEGKKLGRQTVFDFETPAANWFGVKILVPNCFDI